jgi:hypothetical protein
MSRTYRRCSERHEYRWVLCEWVFESGRSRQVELDRHSPEGRRAIARFHSDAHFTMHGGVPRWFCRIFKRRQRNANTRQLLRWLADPGYDPVMNARHRNSAKWAWW